MRHIKLTVAAVVAVGLVAGLGALAWTYLVPPPAAMPHGPAGGITVEGAGDTRSAGSGRPSPVRLSSMGSIHNAEMRYAFFTPASFLWEFGDGKTGTERDPVHQYDTPGDYSVTLTITSTDGTKHVERRSITVR